jgi:hypothetical protein
MAMSTFVNPGFIKTHPGVNRFETMLDGFKGVNASAESTGKSLMVLLLTAAFSALLVVANQVIDTWTEGHLMLAWIGLWTFVFCLLALMINSIKGFFLQLKASVLDGVQSYQRDQEDQRMWALAKQDPRLMSELKCAMLKSQE